MPPAISHPRASVGPPSRIRWLGLAGVAALALACGSEAPAPERVILVTIDTLRADHVGCYGAENAHTPVLDGLAADGVRFDQAISPVPLTLPSHTSLMTGLEPPAHGVRHNSVFELAEGVPTVAERMAEQGFATAAFVAAAVLDRRYGLARGFETYGDQLGYRRATRSKFSPAERTADEVVDEALGWLQGAPARFLLWVHMYDPHASYQAPLSFRFALPEDPYGAEIAFADEQLGRLLAAVDARWPDGRTLVAVTSDHGEGLGEHGDTSHSYFLYDATQRVPLLLRGPGLPAGHVVNSPVRLMDVAPTLLAQVGVPPLDGIQGSDLTPLIRDEGAARPAYLETLAPQLDLGLSPLLGLRTQQWKYIRAPEPELYDLGADPRELENLAASRADVVAALDAELEQRSRGARPVTLTSLPTPEERARLESLGYVVPDAVDVDDLGRVGGEDPKRHVGLMDAMNEVRSLLSNGRPREALALLAPYPDTGSRVALMRAMAAAGAGEPDVAVAAATALLETGSHVMGRVLLGTALVLKGEVGAARTEYEAAIEADPTAAAPWISLGRLEELLGKIPEARRAYERGIELNPLAEEAQWRLAALLLETGEAEASEAILRDLPEESRTTPAALIRLALAEDAVGRRDAGIARLRAGARQYPETPQIHTTFGALLAQAGQAAEARSVLERIARRGPLPGLARNNLAWALVETGGDADRALALIEATLEELGRHAAFLDTLAQVQLARGDAAAARSAAEEGLALAQPEERAHLYYLLAQAEAGLGRPAAARTALARAREGWDAPPSWAAGAEALAAKLGS